MFIDGGLGLVEREYDNVLDLREVGIYEGLPQNSTYCSPS